MARIFHYPSGMDHLFRFPKGFPGAEKGFDPATLKFYPLRTGEPKNARAILTCLVKSDGKRFLITNPVDF